MCSVLILRLHLIKGSQCDGLNPNEHPIVMHETQRVIHFSLFNTQAAFGCIRNLWNRKPLKVYGGRMAESMLAILCHILRGEPIIQERLAKEREGSARTDEDGASGAGGASVAPGAGAAVGEGAPGAGAGTAGTASGSAEEGSNSTPRREPQVNQAQLTQVMVI